MWLTGSGMVIIRTVLKKFFRFLSVCGGNRCDFAPLQWGCVRTELGMRCSLAIRCRTSRPLRDDTEVQIAGTATHLESLPSLDPAHLVRFDEGPYRRFGAPRRLGHIRTPEAHRG